MCSKSYNYYYLIFLLFLICGCCARPQTAAYREQYVHLKDAHSAKCSLSKSPFFLVFLVDARHLDYSNNCSFLKTLAKHPSDGSKNGDVGHCWVYLHGVVDGYCYVLEGGHSGETVSPKYFESVINAAECGYDPNPIQYLWHTRGDGFYQEGNGKHCPTYAAKVNLTEEEFNRILKFIFCYRFEEYALTGNQCATFVAQIAAMVGLPIACDVSFEIEPFICIGGDKIHFWNDPDYSLITIPSPDIVEKSLIQLVSEGKAEYALPWYRETHCYPLVDWNAFKCFPERIVRFYSLPSLSN